MKIITEGELPETRPIRTTCRSCRTLFEFTPAEATRVSDQRDGDYYRVTCPLPGCHKEVTVSVQLAYPPRPPA